MKRVLLFFLLASAALAESKTERAQKAQIAELVAQLREQRAIVAQLRRDKESVTKNLEDRQQKSLTAIHRNGGLTAEALAAIRDLRETTATIKAVLADDHERLKQTEARSLKALRASIMGGGTGVLLILAAIFYMLRFSPFAHIPADRGGPPR